MIMRTAYIEIVEPNIAVYSVNLKEKIICSIGELPEENMYVGWDIIDKFPYLPSMAIDMYRLEQVIKPELKGRHKLEHYQGQLRPLCEKWMDLLFLGMQIMGGKENLLKFCRYLFRKCYNIKEQKDNGWRLDMPLMLENIKSLSTDLSKVEAELSKNMPKPEKRVKKSRPKRYYKKDGSLTKAGQGWEEYCKLRNLDCNLEEITTYEEKDEDPKPFAFKQQKEWLYSLGWQPETFKFQRNKKTGEVKKIEQVVIPDSGGKLCPSVLKLSEKEPSIKLLAGASVKRHRLSVLQGFRDCEEGGEIKASVSGFTNTLRFSHEKPATNLPKDPIIRECLIADPGNLRLGYVIPGRQDKTTLLVPLRSRIRSRNANP